MEKKETPRDLRKKIKRLDESRNLQMAKSREKSTIIKANQGRINELTESRNNWKKKFFEMERNNDLLKKEVIKKDCEFKDLKQELISVIKKNEKLLEKIQLEKINNENEFQQKNETIKKKSK